MYSKLQSLKCDYFCNFSSYGNILWNGNVAQKALSQNWETVCLFNEMTFQVLTGNYLTIFRYCFMFICNVLTPELTDRIFAMFYASNLSLTPSPLLVCSPLLTTNTAISWHNSFPGVTRLVSRIWMHCIKRQTTLLKVSTDKILLQSNVYVYPKYRYRIYVPLTL